MLLLVDDPQIRDPVLLGEALHEGEDARQEVEVLVSVRVLERDPGGEERFDLCAELALDLVDPDAPGEVARHEVVVAAVQQAAGADERLDVRRNGTLFDEGEVDADRQLRIVAEPLDRMLERRAVRHDAARGDDPRFVGQQRAVGHAAVETDVVGGDDEAVHVVEGRTPSSARPRAGRLSSRGRTGASAAPKALRRISGYNATSSRKILKITAGDDKCDTPRVRGK